uniref:Glomulin, FKBP associated protein n=1 Tax=Sus scrofa TaxID=9823 RepID=A0A8D1DJ55_PIG
VPRERLQKRQKDKKKKKNQDKQTKQNGNNLCGSVCLTPQLFLQVIVKNMGWNLVGPVVRCLLWNDKEDEKRKYYFLMLDLLVELCNPKELLLGLLELIEEPSGKQISTVILLLLRPLQTVIQKLRHNRAYSVGLALSTLWSQLSVLPVPYTQGQMQADEYGLCQCCEALVEFTKPFVEEVTGDEEPSVENEKLKDELLKFCFKSLKCPLLTAQFLEPPEQADTDPLRRFAAEIIGFLSAIGYPFPKVIFNHGRKKKTWDYLEFEEEEDKQLSDSMASLAYLVFVQGISIDQLPMVLSPSYLLQFNMGHIEVLLQRTEESVLSKGLDLLENSLLRTEDSSLLHQCLEIKSFLTVPQAIYVTILFIPLEHLTNGLQAHSWSPFSIWYSFSQRALRQTSCKTQTGEGSLHVVNAE